MRINRIEIQNYKAFKDLERLEIEGVNVLVYGNNGSGKTAFANALRDLLQSGDKTAEGLESHFAPQNEGANLNLFAEPNTPAFVRITTDDDTTFEFSSSGNTDDGIIRLSNQASDFMNYRLLFRFYNFRDAENADIFPIFEHEFFPYWTIDPDNPQSYEAWYKSLTAGLQELQGANVRRNSRRYKDLLGQTEEFNNVFRQRLENLVRGINDDYLRAHFLPDEPIEVGIEYAQGLRLKPDQKWEFDAPIVQLNITYDGNPITRPHVFLNESRLTALALSIRLAAFDQRLKASDFQILVLDDLLISLDMSMRMKVINIILEKYAPDYQLFILTHDRGFFNVIKQNLILQEDAWKCFEFYENRIDSAYANPLILPSVDAVDKAKSFLAAKDYESCALYLRRKVEELIRIYFDPTLEELARFHVLEPLAGALNNVEKEHDARLRSEFLRILNNPQMDAAKVQQLRKERFQGDDTLTPVEIGQIDTFRKSVLRFLEKYYTDRVTKAQKRDELLAVVEKVAEIRSRILNIGAHHTTVPLYESELKDAIETIEAFEQKVKKST